MGAGDDDMLRLSRAALASERLREDEEERDDALRQHTRRQACWRGAGGDGIVDGSDAAQDGWRGQGSDSPIGDWNDDGTGGAEWRTGEQLQQLTRAAMAVEALRSLDREREREREVCRGDVHDAGDACSRASANLGWEESGIEGWGSGGEGRESEDHEWVEEYACVGGGGALGEWVNDCEQSKTYVERTRAEDGSIANPPSRSGSSEGFASDGARVEGNGAGDGNPEVWMPNELCKRALSRTKETS